MESLATINSNGVPTMHKDIEESPSPAADTNGNLAASCASPSPSDGSSAPEATSAPAPSAITDAVTNTDKSSTPLADTISGVIHTGEPKPAGGSTSKNKKKKKKKVSSASSGTSAPVPEAPTPRTSSGGTENGDSREDMSVRAETSTAGGVRGDQRELGKADSGSGVGAVGAGGAAATGASNGADILRLLKKQQIEKLVAKAEAKANKEHKFWDTQPMKKPGEDPEEPGEIETKTIQDVNPEPCSMPAGFEWCHVDVMDEAEAEEVYTLLSENYVEDDDNMFRFDYSKEFLRWALTPPGYSAELHVGVRSSKGKLMALITAVPTQMRVVDASIRTVEINFLCVHKKLRSKRLAPVLIKEITRRVNRRGIWQAVYTAGVVLPTPLACCRYFHRSLNPKKLIEVGFSRLSNRMTMARTLKLYKLPDRTNSANISVMTADDVPSVHSLLTEYLKQFKLAPEMTEEEIGHWLLPREGVVDCFVVRDSNSGKVTDMCSFYHLPSTVIGHQKHRTLNAAYSFYNVATTVSMTELMRDSLILARNLGMDVFNALNLMQNNEFLQTLKFGIGDGHLQYYLYNWRCKEITPEEVGLVLL